MAVTHTRAEAFRPKRADGARWLIPVIDPNHGYSGSIASAYMQPKTAQTQGYAIGDQPCYTMLKKCMK